ncbi:hypothetical protein VEx25_1680, partial [Vibrio antiquarius]
MICVLASLNGAAILFLTTLMRVS